MLLLFLDLDLTRFSELSMAVDVRCVSTLRSAQETVCGIVPHSGPIRESACVESG